MTDKIMFMGPRGALQAVPACTINPDFSAFGWTSKSSSLNGRANVRGSFASHKEYAMSWSPTSRDRLRVITDIHSGMFGTGAIFFLDPMAMDKNVLPEHWGFPAQAALDAPVLVGDVRPTIVATPANGLGYPINSVTYSAGAALALHIPIPAGFVAWVGWHGSGSGGLKVTPVISSIATGTPEYPTVLAVTDAQRMNASYAGPTYVGIDLELVGGTGSVFSGIMVQVLPAGVTPETGGFISGQGNAGCKFEGAPTQTPYGAALDLVGMSAKLTESDD